MTDYSADVPMACNCLECQGTQTMVPPSRARRIQELDDTARDRIIHRLVSQEGRNP